MHSSKPKGTRGPSLARVWLIGLVAAGAVAALAETPPDAVIEQWVEHWTLMDDGSQEYYCKQHVQLNSDRVYGAFADPRITYNVTTDKLEIINARVKRPDGSYRELPDYSHVQVTPDATAGWPAFADIQQHLLVMSGIEPGCVVELEYKITSAPGSKAEFAADVRLDSRYPVLEREIQVQAPEGVQCTYAFRGVSEDQLARAIKLNGSAAGQVDVLGRTLVHTGRRLMGWVFHDLPPTPDEPQSPPWQARAARFAFSSIRSSEAWLRSLLDQLDAAADDSPLAARLAAEWTKDRFGPAEKLQAIQEKLAATFNFVDFNPAWQPARLRLASETLRCNYGLPAEGVSAFLALARAAGVHVYPGVLVDDDVWIEETPQRAFVSAYVLLFVDPEGELEIWDAQHGRLYRDAHWAGHTLLTIQEGQLVRSPWPAWTHCDESRCRITGKLNISEDGTLTGSFTLDTTGLFATPDTLSGLKAQKKRAAALLGHVVPGLEIESCDTTALAPGAFSASVKVKSAEPLSKVDGAWCLKLAETDPFAADVPMPVTYSRRENPVRLTGAFTGELELVIEWPSGWQVAARPMALPKLSADAGMVSQSVTPAGENGLMLKRVVLVPQPELSPAAFLGLRPALNKLRAPAYRTLVLQP